MYYNIIYGNNNLVSINNINDFETNNFFSFISKYDDFKNLIILNEENKNHMLFLKNKINSNILEDFYISRFDINLDDYEIKNNPKIIFLRENYE